MKPFLKPAHPWRHRGKLLLKSIFWLPYLPATICWNLLLACYWAISSPWYLYRLIRPKKESTYDFNYHGPSTADYGLPVMDRIVDERLGSHYINPESAKKLQFNMLHRDVSDTAARIMRRSEVWKGCGVGKVLHTSEGREALAQAMAEPIRQKIERGGISSSYGKILEENLKKREANKVCYHAYPYCKPTAKVMEGL